MQFLKFAVIFQFALGILSLLVTSSSAVSESVNDAENLPSFPLLCQPEESLFIVAETSGFWINICGGDLPHFYIGKSKTNGNQIRLPLKDYEPQGNYFEAVNGDISYLLIRGSAKGDFLTVTQGDKEVFRQPVLEMLDFLNPLLNRHPERIKANVEIYTWTTCPFCIRAKLLLWWKGVNFTEYKIDGDNEARNDMAQRANGRRTVPQIFVNDRHLGGCDDLYEKNDQGQLDGLLVQSPSQI